MVRFIMDEADYQYRLYDNLHSNMVRFIIDTEIETSALKN